MKKQKIRIGNQTAFSASALLEPFHYAVANGFDAFEWFPDKKEPGGGWDSQDMDKETRAFIRETAARNGIALSVHAPWWADPLNPDGRNLLYHDLVLARDLGAGIFNIHLYNEEGIDAYVRALAPFLQDTAGTGIKLSIENTVLTPPEDFNLLFSLLNGLEEISASHVGMCLDLGHANLCSATLNNYLDFMDRLAPDVPITHIHLHENFGDRDSHLPLFTGPAGANDAGIRAFLHRLKKRGFSGSIIFEQWPDPPTLLNEARDRLREMLREQNCNFHHKDTKSTK